MTDTFTDSSPAVVGYATKKSDIDKVYANTRYLKEVLGGIVSKNLAGNPDFRMWSAGAALAPDYYVLSGASASIAQTGVGLVDTQHKDSDYAAKVIAGGGAPAVLKQRLLPSTAFNNVFRGLYASLGVRVRCGTASAFRAAIYDGAGSSFTAYHGGSLTGGPAGDGWEWLTVTRQLAAAATEFSFQLELAASRTGWIGAVCPMLSLEPPTYMLPPEVLPDRTAVYAIFGPLPSSQTAIGGVRFSPPRPCFIRNIRLALGTAPSGDVVVDVKKNGTSMFVTTFPKITSGNTSGSLVPNAVDVTTRMIGPTDKVTVDLVSIVGSPADLTVHVDMMANQRPLEAWLAAGDLN